MRISDSQIIATDDSSKMSDIEAQLRETIQRYELIFKATNDVLYDLNIHTAQLVWNDALFTQYGYAPEEPAGTLEWWTRHIHPEDALRVENLITDAIEAGMQTVETEYRFMRADNSYVEVRDRGYILRDSTGVPVRLIGSFLDITQQNQLNRAKDEFISLVSHQLRTPLTIIRFYSEMLLSGMLGKLADNQTSHVEHIAEASTGLIQLVGDILNVSRIELERIYIQPQPTDVAVLIQRAINLVSPVAAERNVVIRYAPDPSVPNLAVDDAIFEQVLDNLLSNAIRYTKKSQGLISVSFTRTEHSCVLEVCDNGIGIPKKAQSHIFERFFRADNARNIIEEGTGLGLYYIKILTKAFGGEIWFTSRAGKGSSFFVSIPLTGMLASTKK